ncbi:LysR family transcriptional regulator [Pseudogemmobacter humi]|uniref:HTH-type transcriptional regulator CynR n=1 Tax=Pseudogemmobacter humi TaxID=2483812 RepID=A0A3P5XP03_9RHOB|nr:LysR family transcriptional regulator [Pseudogemmobacter humi]VDC30487.1 HTH-type transcriptional regulator CynR [Pseudogemmobacter humi]
MRFKLRQMEVFRAIMLTGSMSAAARMLNISQPAVSRLIGYTEQSLGLKLFERTGHRLTPTREALILIPEVEALYQGAQRIDSIAGDLANKPTGTLTIATSPSLALHAIPAVIARFMAGNPGMHIRYHTALLSEIPDMLISRRTDLAITVLPVEHSGIQCEPLGQGRMLCLLPAHHPLAMRASLGLADLAGEPLILYDRTIPFGKRILAAFHGKDLLPRIAMEVPRAELAISMVQAGVGPAIIDEYAVADGPPPKTVVVSLKEAIPLSLSLLQSAWSNPDAPGLQQFIRLLRRHLVSPSRVAPRQKTPG